MFGRACVAMCVRQSAAAALLVADGCPF